MTGKTEPTFPRAMASKAVFEGYELKVNSLGAVGRARTPGPADVAVEMTAVAIARGREVPHAARGREAAAGGTKNIAR